MSSEPGGAPQRPGRLSVPPGSVLLELAFDSTSLYLLRATVAAHAAGTGLSRQPASDVVITAHELAANAVVHGAGHGQLRLWTDERFLYCQVSDDGPARSGDQQPAGAAAWPRDHGHGLWLIDIITDQFSIDHGPAGTTATAAFALSFPPGPAQPGTEEQ
jgi:anti-sigma regulatory factor (Ser/Thr protein kinase)